MHGSVSKVPRACIMYGGVNHSTDNPRFGCWWPVIPRPLFMAAPGTTLSPNSTPSTPPPSPPRPRGNDLMPTHRKSNDILWLNAWPHSSHVVAMHAIHRLHLTPLRPHRLGYQRRPQHANTRRSRDSRVVFVRRQGSPPHSHAHPFVTGHYCLLPGPPRRGVMAAHRTYLR